MDVRVVGHCRAPGVKHGGGTDASAEVLGIVGLQPTGLSRGGHVERCQDCGHSRIAYNSCRNRHCPRCQGAAAKDWRAAREADLLQISYFHVVFTRPAEIAPIAYQNKAVVYHLLLRTAAETLLKPVG